jgi:hypothetical protein
VVDLHDGVPDKKATSGMAGIRNALMAVESGSRVYSFARARACRHKSSLTIICSDIAVVKHLWYKGEMQKHIPTPRPRVVTYAVAAAWFNWLLAAVITITTTARPELLGVALPTLGTQALLTLGMGWGSNIARMSYFIWSIFGIVLSASAGDVVSNGSAFALWGGFISDACMGITLVGLLVPPANRWYLAQRVQNKAAPASVSARRAKRNLKVATAWLLVLPVSALIAIPLNTPFLAVLLSCGVAMCVGTVLMLRQGFKLYRLRACLPA